MKKIFSIVAFAAAFAFAFTSCKEKPQPEPEVPADFKITVDSLTMTSAFISVEPLDSSIIGVFLRLQILLIWQTILLLN